MKQLKNLSHDEIERIGRNIGSAFVHEAGPFRDYFTGKEAAVYFSCLCQMASRARCLYELKDQRGYLIYFRKHHGFSFFQKLRFALKLCLRMNLEHMRKYLEALQPWQDYEEKFHHEKDYVNLFMVCIPEKQQGRGLLRELLRDPMQLADKRHIPCILDTDSVLKMLKYRHLGFEVTDEMVLPDGNHMYTMKYGS